MPQIEPSTSVIVFSELAGEETDLAPTPIEQASEYFRQRERAERAAAKRAKSAVARSVHQTLAQHYAVLGRGREEDDDDINRGKS